MRASQHVFHVATIDGDRYRLVLRCDCGHSVTLDSPGFNTRIPVAMIDREIVRHHHAVLEEARPIPDAVAEPHGLTTIPDAIRTS